MSNNDNTQHDTDAVLQELEANGYSVSISKSEIKEYPDLEVWVTTPDGTWSLNYDSAHEAANVNVTYDYLNSVLEQTIYKAYAHLQAAQETARLRARVAELEARLERANIVYCLYVESPIDGHFSLFELYSNPFAFRSQLREMYKEVYITGRGRYRDALYIGCSDTPDGDIQSFKLVCHSVKGSNQ